MSPKPMVVPLIRRKISPITITQKRIINNIPNPPKYMGIPKNGKPQNHQ